MLVGAPESTIKWTQCVCPVQGCIQLSLVAGCIRARLALLSHEHSQSSREASLMQHSARLTLGLQLHRALSKQRWSLELQCTGSGSAQHQLRSCLHRAAVHSCTQSHCSGSCSCTLFLTAHLILPVWHRHWGTLNLRFTVGAPSNTDQLCDFHTSHSGVSLFST